MHGSGLDEAAERIDGVKLLAKGDGYVGRSRKFRMTADVVVPGRLFEPEEIEFAGPGAKPLASRKIPFAVAVNGDADVRTNLATDCFETRNV